MPRGIKKTKAERLITLSAINAGFTLEEVNAILTEAGFDRMNANSFKSERSTYAPAISDPAHTYTLREHVFTPRTWDKI
jgi:hypothetical protein